MFTNQLPHQTTGFWYFVKVWSQEERFIHFFSCFIWMNKVEMCRWGNGNYLIFSKSWTVWFVRNPYFWRGNLWEVLLKLTSSFTYTTGYKNKANILRSKLNWRDNSGFFFFCLPQHLWKNEETILGSICIFLFFNKKKKKNEGT